MAGTFARLSKHLKAPAILPPYPGIALPNAPDLIFVRRLGIVGQQRRDKCPRGPSELDPLLRLPAPKDAVEHAADKAVTPSDPVEHRNLTRFDHMPVVALKHDRTPEVTVGTNDLAERGGKYRGIAECLLGLIDHDLEAVDLVRKVCAARLRALDPQAELEVLFISDEYVRNAGDFREDIVQLGLAPLPERGAMVQVE